MSNFRARFPPKHLLSNMFMTPEAMQVQYEICLPFINSLCYSDIILGAMMDNLSTRTFNDFELKVTKSNEPKTLNFVSTSKFRNQDYYIRV